MTPLTMAEVHAKYTEHWRRGDHDDGLRAVVALVAARVREASRVGYNADEPDDAIEAALEDALGDLLEGS